MPTTLYPGFLDSFVDPTPATLENVLSHAAQHSVANDALLALETKLGVGAASRTQTLVTAVTSNQGITPDLNVAQVFRYTLSANVTAINPPVNGPPGTIFTIQFLQDAVGGHTYGGANNVYVTGTEGFFPSPAPNSLDTYTFYWDGTFAWTMAVKANDVTWTPVIFQNGWQNFGSGFQSCQFRKVGSDVVLRGIAKGGTLNVAIFTLPVGYRPAATLGPAVIASQTTGEAGVRLGIATDGTVTTGTFGAPQTNGWVFLDNVRFSLMP